MTPVGPHVLVARLDNAGDVLLTADAVRAVGTRARRITFLASTTGAAAARLLPCVDDVLVFDAPWVSFAPPPTRRDEVDALVDALARCHVDEAMVLTSFHQSPLPLALLLRMAGVGRVGAISVDYPGSLLDVRHQVDEHVHEVERARSLAAAMGYTQVPDRSAVPLRVPSQTASQPFEDPYVVLHPGASVPSRAIDVAVARGTVERLLDGGWSVAVTGTAAERALTAAVVAGAGGDERVRDLGGATDLAGLAAVLTGAAALIAGNTGPAHLAAELGVPVVSVFAPVVPAERWRPYGTSTVVLGDQEIACAGCRARTCPFPGQPCLAGVTPQAITDAVSALTASARPPWPRRQTGPRTSRADRTSADRASVGMASSAKAVTR